ncbi:MAG: TetR/AcrR family transcriptional regulator [Fischerella sp.]|nr:TetR/AcrR family transcriptional regulator [Fischerella sp.]
MSKSSNENSARERVLDVAEQLFASRGYAAVTLKDIAKQLGIKQASLYYHVPGGKEDLFVEVMLRHLERRRQGLEQIIAAGSLELEDCLTRVGVWLLSQPPLNASRIVSTDLPEIAPEKARQIERAMRHCFFTPMERFFARYQDRLRGDAGFIAGRFLSSVEALSLVKRYSPKTDEQLLAETIDLLLHGALKS